MPRRSSHTSTSVLLRLLFLGALLMQIPTAYGIGQQVSNPARPATAAQLKPVSLAHCYWHFLMYQNYLDVKAAEQTTQRRASGLTGTHLQIKLGLTDAEFAPIRTSSKRLAAEVNALNGKAAAIVAAKTPTSGAQLRALTAEREADINAEVMYLRGALGPAKTAAFEAFITQMFSPKTVGVRLTAPPPTSGATGVQP